MSYKYTSAPVEVSFRAGAAAKVAGGIGWTLDGRDVLTGKGGKGEKKSGSLGECKHDVLKDVADGYHDRNMFF